MNTRTSFLLVHCCFLAVASLPAQTNRIAIFPDDDALTPENFRLVWQTTPGLRYEVQQTTNLSSWTAAPGYPATANGPAQQMPFTTEGSARFFRVGELDEQPPAIVDQYPKDGGFAVPRSSKLTFELSDVAGINTNSVQLTVGGLGTFSLVNTQLTFGNGMLIFDAGAVPLGGWGTNVQVTLIAADVLGNRGTNIWNFTLEVQPVVVSNLFVFGSPNAVRAGQLLRDIPTASLTSRSGETSWGGSDSWLLESVDTNRLVLSYTNTVPEFATNTYVCNLTPERMGDIFYRRILSISNNPAVRLLTLFTTNVPLAEILNEASISVSKDSVIYQVDTNGVILPSALPKFSFDQEITFEQVGVNTNVTLFDEGGIRLTLDEAKFLFTPSLELSFETQYLELQRFNATLHGRLETALVPELTIAGTLSDTKEFNLFSHTLVVYVGTVGPVPIWLDFDFNVDAEVGYDLSASATMSTGVRENVDLSFGVDYVKGRAPEVQGGPSVVLHPIEVVPFTNQINGSANAYATLIPQLDLRVDSLAGLYANVDPRVDVSGNAVIDSGKLTSADFCIDVTADLNVGFSVIGADDLPPLAEFRIFEKEWCTNYPPAAELTISRQPRDQVATVGGAATFSVEAVAAQSIGYQWKWNNSELFEQTGPTLLLNNVGLGDAGNYKVHVTAGNRSLDSDTATLTVFPNSLQLGLLAYYPFTGNPNDVSGNGHNGTVEGATLTSDRLGVSNRAYSFDGVNDYIELFSLNSYAVLTLSAWAKWDPGSSKDTMVIVSGDNEYFDRSLQLTRRGVANSSFHEVAVHVGHSVDPDGMVKTGILVPSNTWNQYVVEFTSDNVHVFLNGTRVWSYGSPATGWSEGNWRIGRNLYAGEGGWPFKGVIDNVRIYNRELSPSEVQQLYSLNPPTPPSGMALIPAGSFMMGATTNMGHESYSEEVPQHSVYVSALYMDRYEVTKALWDDVYNWAIAHGYSFHYAGSGKAADHPVQSIDWFDCVKWCNARSEKEGRVPAYYTDVGLSVPYRSGTVDLRTNWVNWGSGYRLPTEAEWEKAARGGASGHRFPWADVDTIQHSRANYYSSSSYVYDTSPTRDFHPTFATGDYPYTSPVGYFAPNGYGLYDMAGNVWEWCWDRYSSTYYSSSPGTDPRGPALGTYRVIRGGSWFSYAGHCRTAYRFHDYYPTEWIIDVGFRTVLPLAQ